jgi:hypothetical protein
MDGRHFSVAEAREALDELRPIVELMVEHRRTLREAAEREARLSLPIAGNGGGIERDELAAAQAEVARVGAEVARCIDEIQQRGAIVKDLDRGLIDFPARRGGETVLLCWLLGEETIEYWHGLEEGFAGRKPLPL